MELNDFKTYLAIGIVGLVVGILYLIIQNDLVRTLSIFYITLYINVTLRYLLERRYYKKHKAILASTQFLLLPFSIVLMGNYISPQSLNNFFIITIDLSGGDSIRMFFNVISLSLILPVILLTIHFNKYYSGLWPAIAIRRKVKRRRSIPILIHTTFIFIILLGFFINGQIDFVSIFFVSIYLIFLFRYFILVKLIKPRSQEIVRTTKPRETALRTTSRSSSSRTSSRRRQATRSAQSSRRAVPVRTRSTRTTASSSSKVRRTSAKIDPGIDIRTTKTTRKISRKRTTVKDFFPAGKASKEEMKCIICYMDFDKRDTRRIILCPHCKYPAHEDEFNSWYQTSKLCARCNKPISVSYVRNPKYRLSTKIYIEKIIDKL